MFDFGTLGIARKRGNITLVSTNPDQQTPIRRPSLRKFHKTRSQRLFEEASTVPSTPSPAAHHRFRVNRVLPVYSQFVRAGECADVFHSFAACGNECYCVIRRHRIRDLHNPLKPAADYESRILYQKFDISTGTMIGDAVEILSVGEDARAIALSGKPYVLTSNSPGCNFNYVLLDVNARRRVNLQFASSCRLEYGKNWQPFVFDNRLFAVHSFSPFRILEIDAETGHTKIVLERDTGLNTVSPHDRYTHFRGGSSAIVLNGDLLGFAHLTLDSGRHLPFRWAFSPSTFQVSLTFDVDVSFLAAQGLHVIDPTSFFEFRQKLYLGLSCSNRDWFYGQEFRSVLLEIEAEAPVTPSPRLPDLLQGGAFRPAEIESPSVHFFRAAELSVMNGRIGKNFEVHWTRGKDDPGFIVHGPYVDLEQGKYRPRLQYSSAAFNWQEVGYWDVCSNSANGQTVIAKQFLRGTEGQLAVVELPLQILSSEKGRGIETRVVSSGISSIRLTDIAIARS